MHMGRQLTPQHGRARASERGTRGGGGVLNAARRNARRSATPAAGCPRYGCKLVETRQSGRPGPPGVRRHRAPDAGKAGGVTRAKEGVKASEWLSHPQLEALASPRASPESAVVLSQLLGPVRFNRRGTRSTRVRPKIDSRASGGTD